MSLSSTTSRQSYAGNGVTTAFSFPYYFLANADLVVKRKVNSTGVETLLVLNTDYTVTGAGVQAGGTVTTTAAPATGTTLIIYRDPSPVQDLDLVDNDALPAEPLEAKLDRAFMVLQRHADLLTRSVRLPEGFTASFDTFLPALLNTAGDKVVAVNAGGTGWAIGPSITDIANAATNAAAAAASAAAAATSASNAATSETNAAASAVAAAASATSAATSAASFLGRDVVYITFADSPVTIAASDRGKVYAVDCTGGNVVMNLPSIAALDLSTAWPIAIKKTDASANTVTVNRNGTDTIDGATSKVLATRNFGAIFFPDTGAAPDDWTTLNIGLTSLAKSGSSALFGAVTLSEGAGVSLTQVGNDIAIATSGTPIPNAAEKTANYTILSTDDFLAYTGTAPATFTLPDCTALGKKAFGIINASDYPLTIALTTGTDRINGDTSVVIAGSNYTAQQVVSYGGTRFYIH